MKNAQIGMEFAHQAVGFGDLKKQHFLNARKFNQAAAELLAEQDYEPALQNALDSLNILCGLTGPESVRVGGQVLQNCRNPRKTWAARRKRLVIFTEVSGFSVAGDTIVTRSSKWLIQPWLRFTLEPTSFLRRSRIKR